MLRIGPYWVVSFALLLGVAHARADCDPSTPTALVYAHPRLHLQQAARSHGSQRGHESPASPHCRESAVSMALSVSAGRSRLSWPKQEVNLVTAFVQAAIARFGFRRQTEALLTLFDAFALGETQRHAKSAGPSEVRVLGDVGLSLGLRRRGLLALCTLRW